MSYFRVNIDAMDGYTPGFQPKEPGYIKLNTNESPYPPSPRVIEALKAACDERLRKYPDPMATAFRRQAAEVLGTVPERILCGNGSDDTLAMVLAAFCGEGDTVAMPYPTYSLYEVLIGIQGGRAAVVEWPEDFSMPPDLAGTGARLTMLCNPNAPSGTLLPPAQVAELARALDGVLLVDEAYVDFSETNCLGLVDEHENVIVARTLSKSYSLAGLRFGYVVAQEPLIEGLAKVKDSYNAGVLPIAGATAAIADQEWFRANVAKIRATRATLTTGLQERGFRCWPSQTNFVLARVPEGRTGRQVFEALFERKILVRYWDARRLDDCLRISVGTDEEIAALLDALDEILND